MPSRTPYIGPAPRRSTRDSGGRGRTIHPPLRDFRPSAGPRRRLRGHRQPAGRRSPLCWRPAPAGGNSGLSRGRRRSGPSSFRIGRRASPGPAHFSSRLAGPSRRPPAPCSAGRTDVRNLSVRRRLPMRRMRRPARRHRGIPAGRILCLRRSLCGASPRVSGRWPASAACRRGRLRKRRWACR